jgi:hypothetical protein
LEAEVEEAHSMLTELAIAIFVAAFAAVFFSFAAAVAVAKVRVVAVAFAGSPFLLVGVVVVVVVVVVVSGKAVHCSFFEEFDLLAVHPVHPWFRWGRSLDSTFVVWLRTMLHYYSL